MIALLIVNLDLTVALPYNGVYVQCPQSELDTETVKSILAEYKIHNADVTLRSDATADDLIDVVEGNRYCWDPGFGIPAVYVRKEFSLMFASHRN